MLENRLDKAMIKYNEAQSIKKTYEQIVKRLTEERVGFDNQLSAIERTLAAKQHDYEELQLLSGDATHAREVAIQAAEKAKQKYKEDMEMRAKDLAERQAILQQKEAVATRMEKREKMRQDMVAKQAGDLSKGEEENLKKSLVSNVINKSVIGEEIQKTQVSLDKYERAFRKIKDATGVSDLNEVINTIINQEDTRNNLKELAKENTTHIEALIAERNKLRSNVDEVKYAGHGGRSGARKMVDELEKAMTQAHADLERNKQKYERLMRCLIDGKAGIEHLNAKLEAVSDEKHNIVMTDNTIVDILYQCEETLTAMLTKIKEADIDARGFEASNSQIAFSEGDLNATRPFNRRIVMGNGEEGEEEVGNNVIVNKLSSLDVDDDIADDTEVTRGQMKMAAQAVVEQKVKKERKKRDNKGVADASVTPPANKKKNPSKKRPQKA
jgi:hypothetical protein